MSFISSNSEKRARQLNDHRNLAHEPTPSALIKCPPSGDTGGSGDDDDDVRLSRRAISYSHSRNSEQEQQLDKTFPLPFLPSQRDTIYHNLTFPSASTPPPPPFLHQPQFICTLTLLYRPDPHSQSYSVIITIIITLKLQSIPHSPVFCFLDLHLRSAPDRSHNSLLASKLVQNAFFQANAGLASVPVEFSECLSSRFFVLFISEGEDHLTRTYNEDSCKRSISKIHTYSSIPHQWFPISGSPLYPLSFSSSTLVLLFKFTSILFVKYQFNMQTSEM